MKANKFLIALALCVGFSSSITITSQTPPASWTQSIKNRLSNWWNGATQQARNVRDYTVDTVKAIPQSVINRVGQWKVSTQQVLLGALVTSLVGLGIYNKDTILDYVGQVADQAIQNPGTAAAIGVAGTGAVAAVGAYAYDQKIMAAFDKDLIPDYSEDKINKAFNTALTNNTVNSLKRLLTYRYNNSPDTSTIYYNIKEALKNKHNPIQKGNVWEIKKNLETELGISHQMTKKL